MRLQAVQSDEGDVWDQDTGGRTAKGGVCEAKRDAQDRDERVEQETRESGSKVKVPSRGAPIRRL